MKLRNTTIPWPFRTQLHALQKNVACKRCRFCLIFSHTDIDISHIDISMDRWQTYEWWTCSLNFNPPMIRRRATKSRSFVLFHRDIKIENTSHMLPYKWMRCSRKRTLHRGVFYSCLIKNTHRRCSLIDLTLAYLLCECACIVKDLYAAFSFYSFLFLSLVQLALACAVFISLLYFLFVCLNQLIYLRPKYSMAFKSVKIFVIEKNVLREPPYPRVVFSLVKRLQRLSMVLRSVF